VRELKRVKKGENVQYYISNRTGSAQFSVFVPPLLLTFINVASKEWQQAGRQVSEAPSEEKSTLHKQQPRTKHEWRKEEKGKHKIILSPPAYLLFLRCGFYEISSKGVLAVLSIFHIFLQIFFVFF
jgi:hypothetical protein